MQDHRVVARDEWLAARRELLAREKELTRLRGRLSAERRALPWVRVEKEYVFDGPDGRETLAGLFGRQSQLAIYHFMLGPGWEQGCASCSMAADTMDGCIVHLQQRGVAFAAVSRAPLPEIQAFQERMGWRFKWVSSHGSDFNFDFGVSFSKDELERGEVCYNYERCAPFGEEAPGLSVFCRGEDGEVFHTYSTYGRGLEMLLGAYDFLDLVPRGRDEAGLPWSMAWVRHHDRYGN